MPKPLASYFFSNNKKEIRYFIDNYSFGGGCVNETLMHLVNPNYGFGGVGTSGIGAYHGYEGFKTFSHLKSVMYKPTWIELPLRYFPYSNFKLNIIKTIIEKF
jgi:aldehyde dehydrogenase (NAD+)